MFAGEIMATPPPGAWFSTGMMTAAQPELNVPMRPSMLWFSAYAFAFWLHLPGSHLPACAVESSHDW